VAWGEIELEPEVADWLDGLSHDEFGQVEFRIDLLAEWGVALREPHTKQLRRGLRELRFHLGPQSDAVRIAYWIGPGRKIVLLTVFRKRRQREQGEIDRAEAAMRRCIKERHLDGGNDDD
jgi:hypothetical protein